MTPSNHSASPSPRTLALSLVLFPALAFAQAGKIESGLSQLVNWLTGIGVLYGIVGIIRAGMKISGGDADGKEAAKSAIFGPILVLCAAPLLQLLKLWFR